MVDKEREIEAAMLRLVAERGADKTICPSEVARRLGGSNPDEWRPLMQPMRHVAAHLAKRGKISIMQRGEPVADPDDFEGVYRIGLPRDGKK